MSAAANKERLKLLMLAKKKDKIKPVKAKRVQEETKEETKEEQKNEPEPVVIEEAPKKAKIEEEDVTALMVPVQLGEQVVNVDQELRKFFASQDQARDEQQGNEMEDEEKNEEAREEENGPDLEDAAKSLIRARILNQAKVLQVKKNEIEDEEDDNDVDVFADLASDNWRN